MVSFHELTKKQRIHYLMTLVNSTSIDFLIDRGFLPDIILPDNINNVPKLS